MDAQIARVREVRFKLSSRAIVPEWGSDRLVPERTASAVPLGVVQRGGKPPEQTPLTPDTSLSLALLHLQSDFAEARLVAFAMGAEGETSRVLSPLMGGEFAYAALAKGQESAPGQPTVAELTELYRLMGRY